uniref:Retroviral polymerase SH3-like domain-containing protein n=1 Tax=Tanacetum cinerariifolium TaxID=118510 RepID=A0A6L2NKQ8_TANCI|nr:hypothetical protein [Tanacetum cinerariifolium]
MQNKKPDLSFIYVFGSLCYLTNDNEYLGKFDAKADIGIFIGHAPAKKAFRIYNRRTRIIYETIHVTFDELTTMASEQFSSGPGLYVMTPATPSTGLVSNRVSQHPCIPPNRDDWDRLFQLMIDEYFNPPTIAVSPVQEAAAHRAEVLADSLVSISISQDAPSTIQEAAAHTAEVLADSLVSISISQDAPSTRSSSNVIQIHTSFEHLGRWTKDHPITNVIDDPSRSVSTRKQVETVAMWCYFDSFLTLIEPKNFKQAITKPSWIDAMQEEIHKFKRLKDESGGVLKNKARLVAQASIQEEGVSLEKSNKNVIAGSKDRPPMLAPGNYVQWKSRIKRYIDTKPNHELIHYCLENPPYKLDWKDIEVLVSEGSLITTTARIRETYKNVSKDIRDQLNAEAEAV